MNSILVPKYSRVLELRIFSVLNKKYKITYNLHKHIQHIGMYEIQYSQ